MKKHFFIFFCFVFCGWSGMSASAVTCSYDALKNWKPSDGDINDLLDCGSLKRANGDDVSPIHVALGSLDHNTDYSGNYEAVKAMLNINPNIANGLEKAFPSKSSIQIAIDNCCNKGNNKTSDIVSLLIEKNPEEINFVTSASMGNQETYNSIWNKKSTMLDYVRYKMQYDNNCKNAEQCKKIEKILVDAGAQTCSELHCDSSSRRTYSVDGKTFDTMEAVEKYLQTRGIATATTVVASAPPTLVATESLKTDDVQVKDEKDNKPKDEVVSGDAQTIVSAPESLQTDGKAEDAVSNNTKKTEKTVDKSNNEKQPQAQTVTKNNMEQKKDKTENVTSAPEAVKENVNKIQKQNTNQNNTDEEKENALEEKQKAYDEAKAKEQSTANKTLTALTTAATGIGGMQLLQGLAEQSSDKDAVADMSAYIETMRCTYGEGQQVKAGPEEIELPGANDQEMMNLRAEYLALAADLKERKEALGIKPGIESEVILDRASTGLYDDETIGITGGNYASLYRAQALDSEADQAKISDQQKTSDNRVKYGAIAAGAGVVVGVAGNSLINGKLGEMLKSKKTKSETEKLLEKEADALKDLQKCLKDAGVQDTDKLEFANFYPSVLSVKKINCKKIKLKGKGVKASEIFADSSNETEIFNSMNKYFDVETISKLVGFSKTESEDNIKGKIKSSISEKQKQMDESKKKDTIL